MILYALYLKSNFTDTYALHFNPHAALHKLSYEKIIGPMMSFPLKNS